MTETKYISEVLRDQAVELRRARFYAKRDRGWIAERDRLQGIHDDLQSLFDRGVRDISAPDLAKLEAKHKKAYLQHFRDAVDAKQTALRHKILALTSASDKLAERLDVRDYRTAGEIIAELAAAEEALACSGDEAQKLDDLIAGVAERKVVKSSIPKRLTYER